MKLICIGHLGHRICYINITEEEAISLYNKDSGMDFYENEGWLDIKELEITGNKFEVYDIWE